MREDACIACCESFSPKGEDLNPVVASLLYTAASKVLEQGGVAGCDVRKALLLREQAEERLTSGLAPIGGTVACDVVLCCTETTSEADLAVQSLLGQRDAHLIIHLVDDGGGLQGVVLSFVLQIPAGNQAQFGIHALRQPVQGCFVTAAPGFQQRGDFCRGCVDG